MLDRLVDGMTVAVSETLDVTVTRGAEVVRLAPAQWTGPVTRTGFVWTAHTVRTHPYAITIEDAARRTRHRSTR